MLQSKWQRGVDGDQTDIPDEAAAATALLESSVLSATSHCVSPKQTAQDMPLFSLATRLLRHRIRSFLSTAVD
jgi:hypothetical protein